MLRVGDRSYLIHGEQKASTLPWLSQNHLFQFQKGAIEADIEYAPLVDVQSEILQIFTHPLRSGLCKRVLAHIDGHFETPKC